jgi:magnesium chelatase subunit D
VSPLGQPATNRQADLVAAMLAVDPAGLGGVALRSAAGPQRQAWLDTLRSLLPADTPWRRVPLHINDDRLLGGLDLAATLKAGRPVAQQGLLAEADGGIAVLAMAERLSASTAANVAVVLDTHELIVERDGIGTRRHSRIGVVALDEGMNDDEHAPPGLRERLAFHLTLQVTAGAADDDTARYSAADVAAARSGYSRTVIADSMVESLCAATLALGIDSLRVASLACRAARVLAALDARAEVNVQDAACAAALVLAPRATQAPAANAAATPAPAPEAGDEAAPQDPPDSQETVGSDESPADDRKPGADGETETETETVATPQGAVDDQVLEAALAALPAGLLASLALGAAKGRRSPAAGRAGAAQLGSSRGRPVGARRGEPQRGARLHVVETLRAAAPWQVLRQREARAAGQARTARVQVRREDFHVCRYKQRSETTTVFVVDASGSAALHRLAETKGAVELLLADCYVRRDSVAVIAFRGTAAELLLPPTRSLVRAKRSLAGLPGGGGTPLAAGIASAHALADTIRRRGATPVLVLMTDGRANIARDGAPGRQQANDDALSAARRLGVEGFSALVLDTSPQAQEPARELAAAMGARYLPLPHAGAAAMSQAVRAVSAS